MIVDFISSDVIEQVKEEKLWRVVCRLSTVMLMF